MSNNSVCHIEIAAKDSKKSAEFYKSLFGWKLNFEMSEDYIFFMPDNGTGGAISKMENFTPGDSIVVYIQVEDIEASLKHVVELGGTEKTAKTEIPGHGWYGVFKDLYGNPIGLFTPKN